MSSSSTGLYFHDLIDQNFFKKFHSNEADQFDEQVDLEGKEIDRSKEYDYILLRSDEEKSFGLESGEESVTLLPKDVGDDGEVFNSSILNENVWAVFDEQYLRNSLGWTVMLIVAYTLILIIGIVGNCMVILVVIKRTQMRTVTNMFIMNLAVADLFVIVFCVPATLLSNVFTPWILGSVMCKGVAYVQGVSVCASAYSLAAISLDRCKAIYRPLKRPYGLSKSQALFTICFIWVIAMLLTIPWAVIFDVVVSKRDGLSYCIETWENETHGKIYFLVANLFFCYSLPLILISISNVIIWCHVAHRKVPEDSASATIIKKMHRRTRQGVRKMLGIVTLAFCLSWLPLYILVTRAKFAKNISEWESNFLDVLMPLAQWLGSWNSSINPVLYAFLNSKFREMFKSLLPSWLPCVRKNTLEMVTRNIVRSGISNGTLSMRTAGSGSFTTARNSTGRSSNNSRRFHHYRNSQHNNSDNRKTLLLSSFRGDFPPSTTGVITTATVSTIVGCGYEGNGTSSVMTTTTIAIAAPTVNAYCNGTTTSIITDL